VISIDETAASDRPQHLRIEYVTGVAHDASVVAAVRDAVGASENGTIILGTRGRVERMRSEFEAYAPFVGVGSYVIVEHTVLNGYPVVPGFGPGPREAVRRILDAHAEFFADTRREKSGLTFNAGGYLRRVR
jgi:cephalosporin hydroxylase